ncbi:FAD-binding oxidoreductase [Nocardia sp. NPDC052316]|uniref:FAD-binding oxidoreductase n=1 Tax=Nocardia sp. NPDC052316 TaxID=3364329 RepID=UPI0037CA0403
MPAMGSPYRLIPKVVVNPRTVEEVAAVLRYARTSGLTVTFRAAGTSPSGQAVGDGILVDVRRGWAVRNRPVPRDRRHLRVVHLPTGAAHPMNTGAMRGIRGVRVRWSGLLCGRFAQTATRCEIACENASQRK